MPGLIRRIRWAGALAPAAALAALVSLASLPASSGAQSSTRIVGGSTIPVSSAPWQVSILDGNNGIIYCGGALIRPRVVLTAAHCLLPPSPFATSGANDVVHAGATDWADPSQGVIDHIAAGVANPAFNANARSSDAAILILDDPISSAVATPIKLAGPDEKLLWRPGKPATVSGYGAVSEGGPAIRLLKAATVPILSDASCNSTYPGIFSAATELCAGYASGGTDACQGDSGGPLTVPARGGDGGFVRQVGLVSFGNGCAKPNAPGVYSRVGVDPLRAFVQGAVNASPDPGDVIGNGGVCAGLKGKALKRCKCNVKTVKKKRRQCLRKLKARKRGRG